jgi:hypothetical protein
MHWRWGVLVSLHLSTQPTWPQLYAGFVFCLLSFLHLPSPSVKFLGQAHAGHERIEEINLTILEIHSNNYEVAKGSECYCNIRVVRTHTYISLSQLRSGSKEALVATSPPRIAVLLSISFLN